MKQIGSIPDYVQDALAAALLDGVRKLLRQPGGEEILEKGNNHAERSISRNPRNSPDNYEYYNRRGNTAYHARME